ncbi:MAG: hypothetical protein JWM11_3468 [Planctomycetaceae bacterium]|nr:hypothetical protein [Planctomycetaceae bacterium]
MFVQFLEAITNFIDDNWMKLLTGLALMVLGWYFGKRKAHADWQKHEFLHRLNISLNLLLPSADKQSQLLQIRTVLEKSCEDIFLNSVASDAAEKAARKTTAENPILPLPKQDYWYYLNSVLNEIAEKFALGEIRRDLGLPVSRGKYLICLTCECAGEMRTRKVRAMVIQKQHLENLPAQVPTLEHPSHITRWETLQVLAAEYKKNPWQFLEIELSVG